MLAMGTTMMRMNVNYVTRLNGGKMRVDIQPQWRKLADWYWDSCEGRDVQDRGMSIWEMLEHNYGVHQGWTKDGYWINFPDEKSYTAFLLRWA